MVRAPCILCGKPRGRATRPVYGYGCEACTHRFSGLVQSMESAEVQPCPRCGSEQMRRLISSVWRCACEHVKHAACAIPTAILKAMEVEFEMALPRDDSTHFEKIQAD